jgi:hypothetical protein
MAAEKKGVRLTLTIEVNEKWAEHQSREDLIETLRGRVEFALGFRGKVKRARLTG